MLSWAMQETQTLLILLCLMDTEEPNLPNTAVAISHATFRQTLPSVRYTHSHTHTHTQAHTQEHTNTHILADAFE